MDILASMLAYLASLAGIVGALGISVFLFFSPARQEPAPSATAFLVQPSEVPSAETMPNARFDRHGKHAATFVAHPRMSPVTTLAEAPRQNRRLVEKERAKRLAFRERSDFETRFLHETN